MPEEIFQLHTALQEIVDADQQQFGREGLGDIGICTALKTLYLMMIEGTGRQEDDGDMGSGCSTLDALTEFQTVHHGHHHIGDNQVGYDFISQSKPLLPIGSLTDLVLVMQNGAQVGADICIIVDNQYGFVE